MTSEIKKVLKFPQIDPAISYPGSLAPHRYLLTERKEPMKILDIGSGKARCRPYFISMGHEYITLDIQEGIADVTADMSEIPFEDESFDAVLSTSALQFSTNPAKVIAESFRVLNKGGTFSGSIAFLEPWTWEGNLQVSPGGLFLLLQEQGFHTSYIWPSWSVFEALNSAMEAAYVEEEDLTRAIAKAEQIFQEICIKNPNLLWKFAAALNFHAKKRL